MLLYKNVDVESFERFIKSGKIGFQGRSSTISTTKNKSSLMREFGNKTLVINTEKLPDVCKVIEVKYDLAWFTQNSQNRKILAKVTGRTESEWREWAVSEGGESENEIINMIESEICELYAAEDETVITNLKSISNEFASIEVM